MKVSIIIVSWNARPLLEKCLPSVCATDYPDVEIIVADNASTDDSIAWLTTHYPSVHVVRHPANWAFARGNNAAVPYATGDIIVLLNNDVEVSPGWLTPLVDRFKTEPDLGAVQPKLLQYTDRSKFEYAGASGGFLDRLGYPFTRGRMLFQMETDTGQYDDARDIFWASGAAIMVRREAWEAAGGLDEHFVMHMEEIDFCWRLHRAGWRVAVEPSSVVYHIGGASLPQGSARKTFLNFRNNLLMLYKNLPARTFYGVLAVRSALDVLAAGRAAVAGNPAEAAAIFRAYWAAHRQKGRYRDARPAYGETVPLPYRGVLPWDYYIQGRRTFSALPKQRFTASEPQTRLPE